LNITVSRGRNRPAGTELEWTQEKGPSRCEAPFEFRIQTWLRAIQCLFATT